MRSFSVRPARLILVPSALQSHALLPFRPTSSPSAPPVTRPCAIPSHIILVNPPVTYPFTFPSHIIPVSPSSHTPLCLSVPHHPRQPLQSHALVPFRPTSSSSTPPVTRPCTFPSHIIPVSPPVTRPCAFPSHIILVNPSSHTPLCLSVPHHPRQPLQSHALLPFHFIQHFVPPLRFFSPCPRPSGKVPGISAKMVHFPPQLVGVSALQVPLAALAISPLGESAGNFGENGSLSLVADRGAGSTGLSRGICRFYLRGKCREFRRKRFTFPP